MIHRTALLSLVLCLAAVGHGRGEDRMPGLVCTITAGQQNVKRVDLEPQWLCSAGQTLDKRISSDQPIELSADGWLEVKADGKYALAVYSLGTCVVTIDDVPWIDTCGDTARWSQSRVLPLDVGYHKFKLDYLSAGDQGLLKLYWQGPNFQLEPLSSRYLSHSASADISDNFPRGRLLSHALRCAACHSDGPSPPSMPAADLTALSGNLQRDWLIEWLQAQSPADRQTSDVDDDQLLRRMPHLALTEQEAADIAEALFSHSKSKATADSERSSSDAQSTPKSSKIEDSKGKKSEKSKAKERTGPDAARGREVLLTSGCVACHWLSSESIGLRDLDDENNLLKHRRFEYFTYQLFAGGDLSAVGHKRPADFFNRWLSAPEALNAAHRMPVPDLDQELREDVSLYLTTLKGGSISPHTITGEAVRGQQLIAKHRCGQCHALPAALTTNGPSITPLTSHSDWSRGCLQQANPDKAVPGFGLTDNQTQALKEYWTTKAIVTARPKTTEEPSVLPPDIMLAERNCLACHARNSDVGLTARATQLIGLHTELAARLPAMLPPSLTGVGDKLHDQALAAAINRTAEPMRPWLDVRMPRYSLTGPQLKQMVDYFVATDRLAELPQHQKIALPDDVVTRSAAGRLVTSEGFGCQSCHKIGDQPSPTVALGARGTDLTMLGQRLRQSWFDRWVRNPVRMVPRMEMPAIQLAVHGVLDNDLNKQIDAVWQMLNTPGFQPPAPAPVRIVRGHNDPSKTDEPIHVLTDVVETKQAKFLKPIIVGLPNRHNVLFDFQKGEITRWWLGDTARESTRGKSWYWELGGQPLGQLSDAMLSIDGVLDDQGKVWQTKAIEQFAMELDGIEHIEREVVISSRLHVTLDDRQQSVPIVIRVGPSQSLEIAANEIQKTGMVITYECRPPRNWQMLVGHSLELEGFKWHTDDTKVATQIDQNSMLTIESSPPLGKRSPRSVRIKPDSNGVVAFTVHLTSRWPVDTVPISPVPIAPVDNAKAGEPSTKVDPVELDVVPGCRGVQLPLPRSEMPTALAWYKGQLAIGSLKGRVCLAVDSDRDGLPDQWKAISDDLPAPYGLAAHENGLDVLAKFALLRLTERDSDRDQPWPMQTIADGWGYTADYHDWAVGLERDQDGCYYIALPCQQDDRSPSAARLRGTIQKLIPEPRSSGHEGNALYRLETVAAGLRFPMGLALNSQKQLFASDNQGNYNPFNELNHIQSGKRYGFINKLENHPDFKPPLESPAINLPHPWTRSVNGICFLSTPAQTDKPLFGPFEDHLIGCEYNGLSLIRMSLEEVDGVMQGAAYPFSRPVEAGEKTFEGPVVCAVSPKGVLTVGSIHDSGWGGGQNTGSIVELSPTGQWPLGIACVKARADGLLVQYTADIDSPAVADPANYTVRSYKRISTPAYGGSDVEERNEVIERIVIPEGSRSQVQLHFGPLREDCVYELHVGKIADPQAIFPNEAHYTMKKVPRVAEK